jgi:hypothetical protein
VTEPRRRAELERLLDGLVGQADRLLEAAASFQAALSEHGIQLVVVGGSAITAWDPRIHTSLDIDFVGPALSVELDEVFCGEFGLRLEGRHWYDEQLRLVVERPASTLEPVGAETAELATSSGAPLIVIALEDLILDRVGQWEATGAYDAWAEAAGMLAHSALDSERLGRRVQEVDMAAPLAVIQWLAAEHAAGRTIDTAHSHRAQAGLSGGRGLEGAVRSVAEYRAAGAHRNSPPV